MNNHYMLIQGVYSLILIMICACGQPKKKETYTFYPESDADIIKKIEHGKKRPLRFFTQEDVARYAVAVVNNAPPDDFAVDYVEDGVQVTSKKKHAGTDKQYIVKIGGYGHVLCKDKNGKWTDIFKDRRIYYYEENKKLYLSQTFPGDSATVSEFTK